MDGKVIALARPPVVVQKDHELEKAITAIVRSIHASNNTELANSLSLVLRNLHQNLEIQKGVYQTAVWVSERAGSDPARTTEDLRSTIRDLHQLAGESLKACWTASVSIQWLSGYLVQVGKNE